MARVLRSTSILAALSLLGAATFIPATDAEEVQLVTSLAGRGCCSADHPPTLAVRGVPAARDADTASVEFRGEGAPSDQLGVLLVSKPLAAPTDLHNGAFLYVDPVRSLRMASFTVGDDGSWTVTRPLQDLLPALEQPWVVVAAFVDPGMSIGYALSDAITVEASR